VGTCGGLFVPALGAATAWASSRQIPGEGQTSVFFTITHLPPVAYVVLFLIFLLSLINLMAQGGMANSISPLSRLAARIGRSSGRLGSGLFQWTSNRGLPERRPGGASHPDSEHGRTGAGHDRESAMRAGRVGPVGDRASRSSEPTPLDGVNHPMPRFFGPTEGEPGAPRMVEDTGEKRTSLSDFKFSSAVDVLTAEEIRRRGREQLVVSGSVKGPDGKGVASVIVYLADEHGRRVGQSSRTAAETGEFKVLINEPGAYELHAYKRGYVMETGGPMALPIQSGKIEGYSFRMIPEGCLIHGQIIWEEPALTTPGLEIACVCKSDEQPRSTRADRKGQFRISGAPLNSECFIEVRDVDGKPLASSMPFQTVQRKEIFQEIRISATAVSPPDVPPIISEESAEKLAAASDAPQAASAAPEAPLPRETDEHP